jgi:hypothetical protein
MVESNKVKDIEKKLKDSHISKKNYNKEENKGDVSGELVVGEVKAIKNFANIANLVSPFIN